MNEISAQDLLAKLDEQAVVISRLNLTIASLQRQLAEARAERAAVPNRAERRKVKK